MKKIYLTLAILVGMIAVLTAGCGSSKSLGKKEAKEECEVLAMESSKTWRASGMGSESDKEDARSEAELTAKTRLAQMLSEQIEAARERGSINHRLGTGSKAGTASGKSFKRVDAGYVLEILRNVRTICYNSYVQPDGSYHAYVCVEMGESGLDAIHRTLSDDERYGIDFDVKTFKEEMQSSKEEYLRRQQQGR